MKANRLILPTPLRGVFVAKVQAADPLTFWNDTAPKKAIVAFVERVTREGRVKAALAE